MSIVKNDPLLKVESTLQSLLHELQILWDEVGETEADREKLLLEIQQECLEVYRRKIDQANNCRDQLRQTVADSEAALAAICSTMGEQPENIRQFDENQGSLKETLCRICSQLEEIQTRKSDRINQFLEVLEQIQQIRNEINGTYEDFSSKSLVDESNLSMRKLEELHRQLHALQEEKCDRLKQIRDHLNTLKSLCSVLGMSFKQTVCEVDQSLTESEGSWSVSNDTIEKLSISMQKFRKVKKQRMEKLQDLATTLLELWNLMDTPMEEQQLFLNITCNIAASEDEITEPNSLSVGLLKHVEAEVSRLDELKSSKIKELVLNKKSELEEICRKTHMAMESDRVVDHAIEAIESGDVEPASVLEQIELQIAKVKEEAFSRKEILEKVEKWLVACDEENWLEEYNMDENRYNAGKGTHLNLKRAEKARALVNKIPGMVEGLTSKTLAWEKERGMEFLYDGVSLVSMLDDYKVSRQEKEQERRRQREQKKLQQLIGEQEAVYGSKLSPSKLHGAKKSPKFSSSMASPKKITLGETFQSSRPGSPQSTKSSSQSRSSKKVDHKPQDIPLQSPE